MLLIAVITAANGVSEELFYRGAVYSTLAKRCPVLVSAAIYTAVIATAGIPLLTFAGFVLGLVTAVQRRCTGGILAPAITHVAWSMTMLFALGPLLDFS
ncbi:CPBP family intramembrane glutamic endopeptidase [Dietzia sp.]|uniref:CPBP family intramembrane glutamic endopeptidase n=1 Tax=Dietzia sp. TaxID=1871616 RepID=UPI002FDB2E37